MVIPLALHQRVQARWQAVCRNSYCDATELIAISAGAADAAGRPRSRVPALTPSRRWASLSRHGNIGPIKAPHGAVPRGRREGLMDIIDVIIWLVVGGVAGWLAGLIVKGYGLGVVGNIIVGIVGAFIAGWLLPKIGIIIIGGWIAALIDAVIGAVILLLIIGFFKKA
jgi:uncharacterized membrane protein YeaQ/YmgE (transglycosylase-associated protein family)